MANETSDKAPRDKTSQRSGIRHGLQASKLPPNCMYIENRLNKFRRELEDRVITARGQVTMTDAAHIQSALRWERHSALCARWLRIEGQELKPADRLQFSREVARSSSERDKSIKALDLDAPVETITLAEYLEEPK